MRASFVTLLAALIMLGQTACSTRQEEPAAYIYRMGERVTVGSFVYTIFDRQWMVQAGTGLDARVPQNRFYAIRMSAVNSGNDAAIIPAVYLVDDAGTAYPEIQNGDGIPDFIGALRMVAPAETARGNLVFDVQPKHYRLKLSDEDGKQFALVDIPLNFDPDVPDVTTPLNADPTLASPLNTKSDSSKK